MRGFFVGRSSLLFLASLAVTILSAISPPPATAQLSLGEMLVVDDTSNACPSFAGAIFKVDLEAGALTPFACPSDGPPSAITISAGGRIFMNGAGNSPCAFGLVPLFEIDPDDGSVSKVACSASNWDELVTDGQGNLIVLDKSDSTCGPLRGAVREVPISDLDNSPTGGPWCSVDWFSPHSLAVEADGSILVSTTVQGGTAELYRIDRATDQTTLVGDLAGTFIAGHLVVASAGAIFLTDWSGPPGCLRGDVKTVNGSTGATASLGCTGDFWFPNGIVEGPGGDLFMADRDSNICPSGDGTVWRMDSSTGAILDNYCHEETFNPTEIAVWNDPSFIFADGFESGDTVGWSGSTL